MDQRCMMLYQQPVRCSLAPLEANLMNGHQQGPPKWSSSFHPRQRGLLPFISELIIIETNYCDGLVGFKGGSKSLSVPKTAAQETYPDWRISPSYQLRSIFGVAGDLLKLLLSCLLTEGFQTHHGYKLWKHWNLDGPPNSPRCSHQALTPWSPIGLPSR